MVENKVSPTPARLKDYHPLTRGPPPQSPPSILVLTQPQS